VRAATDTDLVELTGGHVEVLDRPAASGAEHLAPLVLLHEGLGSVALWRGFPDALHEATGRRTVVWSRHGYGASAVVTEPRGVDYMHHEADVVLPELLATLEVPRPVLVGHSDGASIALLHAGRHDADLAGVAAFAPHVIVEDESIAGIEAARDAYLTTELPAKVARHHADGDATFWGWNRIWLDPAFRSWDTTDRLPDVRCPVLVVQGEDDEYGTVRQLDLIEAGVPTTVDRVLLPDCRHSPHLDQPEATLAAVVTFLRDRVDG
jgi:pimeloyl-ACP methyl ester carboxylesterase